MTADQWVALVAAIVGGALRVGAPFLFVSLGECLTEKSGRINLGLEGVLVLSAMASFGGAWLTDSAWLGALIGAVVGAMLALLHGLLCSLDRQIPRSSQPIVPRHTHAARSVSSGARWISRYGGRSSRRRRRRATR